MRRTACSRYLRGDRTGIISAHAENSDRIATRCTRNKDHLRACGEQQAAAQVRSSTEGSSPRMRRTVLDLPEILSADRIISAHAENSTMTRSLNSRNRDHLRACGEQDLLQDRADIPGGSSPRMRRTADVAPRSGRVLGIISAHAENSLRSASGTR